MKRASYLLNPSLQHEKEVYLASVHPYILEFDAEPNPANRQKIYLLVLEKLFIEAKKVKT